MGSKVSIVDISRISKVPERKSQELNNVKTKLTNGCLNEEEVWEPLSSINLSN